MTIPGLHPEWEGRRIAHLSDFQVGMWLDNPGTAARMVERLVEDRPDVVLLGGDLIYSKEPDAAAKLNTVSGIIRALPEAGIPTYAVLGNHEVELGVADRVRAALERIGVTVLSNDAVALAPPTGSEQTGPRLHLVGVAPRENGRDRPAAAVGQVPDGAPRLVLIHDPRSFRGLPAGTAPLAVAGHTHGGQVRLPFTPDWSWLELVSDLPADGFVDGYGEPRNQLYVSRGVGFSVVPVRLNCRPELTVFTLRSSAGTTPARSKASETSAGTRART